MAREPARSAGLHSGHFVGDVAAGEVAGGAVAVAEDHNRIGAAKVQANRLENRLAIVLSPGRAVAGRTTGRLDRAVGILAVRDPLA